MSTIQTLKMHIIPFEIITIQDNGYHLIIDVEIRDRIFKMVLDTGASKTVLDKQMLLKSGLSEDELISSSVLSSGLGTNEMQSHTLTLDTLKISTWEVKNIEVAVLDLSSINFAYEQMDLAPVIGVLGNDVLYNYAAVIKYKSKTLRLNTKKIKVRY